MSTPVTESYRHCVEVTRTQARNFYFGIRLLPSERRSALCAVYALARRIDDIGDGPLPVAQKMARLDEIREGVLTIPSRRPIPNDPVAPALHDATARFPIPLAAFEDLIDGVEMDLRGVDYATFDALVVYCRRVAGSIGRLCLGVFETDDPDAAIPLADDLGVALQLTNILRDVVEDRSMGRVYLPVADAERFGLGPKLEGPTPQLADLIRFEARRAMRWFDRGLRLLPLIDRPSAACVGTMAGIYRALLERIEQQPRAVLEGRVSLSGWEKTWVAMRHLAGAAT